jgi:hypothetical protein
MPDTFHIEQADHQVSLDVASNPQDSVMEISVHEEASSGKIRLSRTQSQQLGAFLTQHAQEL